MALVYEAVRETMGGVEPRVALKLILPEHADSDTFKDLFINEARLGARMEHQNLVRILDFNVEKKRHYLVMEYLEGFNLRRLLARCEQHEVMVPVKVIAEIGRQACDGLEFAHQARDGRNQPLHLVHRDMKPSNLMLTPHGIVKVLDFGISKGVLLEERKGTVKGTWGYMAPEQALGKLVTPATDVFGLAIVLYELAAKIPMFRDKPKDEIRRLLQDDHAARMVATLGPRYRDLVRVLVRALQRDPKGRFLSAREFGESLGRIAGDSYHAGQDLRAFHVQVNAMTSGASPAPPEASAPLQEGTRDRPHEPLRVDPPGSTVWFGVLGALGVLGMVVVVGSVVAWLFSSMGWVEVSESPQVEVGEEVSSEPSVPVVVAVQPPVPLPALEPLGPNAGEGEEQAAPEAPSDRAEVTFEGRPPGEVYIDGQYGGATPYTARLPVGSFSAELVAQDGRHKPYTVLVKGDGDGHTVRITDGDTGKGKNTSFAGWDFDRREAFR
jgi:hypothetical protein